MPWSVLLLVGWIILTLPDRAHAWGLATHVELAEMALRELASLSAGVAGLIVAHRRSFLRGNLFADIILGKKFSRRRRLAHHWGAGKRLLANAEDDAGKAFAYGFLSHLAADTVAHNDFVPDLLQLTGTPMTLGHIYWEVRADLAIAPHRRTDVRHLLKHADEATEALLCQSIFPEMRWYALNRSVFMSLNHLVGARKLRTALTFCHDRVHWPLTDLQLSAYQLEATSRMLEIIATNGRGKLLDIDPNGTGTLKALKASRRTAS